MIYNERQYKITAKQIANLQSAFEEMHLGEYEEPEWLIAAQLDALKSQINDLEAQIAEYDLLKEGAVRIQESSDLASLPKALIQSRIAKGMSQKKLAEELGMTAQQVQRYEASNYMGASLSRLIEISDVLGVTVTGTWGGEKSHTSDAIYVWKDEKTIDWGLFPIKEMLKRRWFELEHKETPAHAVQNFVIQSGGPGIVSAFHRKKFHGENRPNEYALLAWQARVLGKARDSLSSESICDFKFDDAWIPELVDLSRLESSPAYVKDFLATKGIILVIEKHLKSTYLDGAAMLLDTGNPVVGLTLRHDRLDNFWFVLMHELGHVFLHLFEALDMDFFDEEGGYGADDIEREADHFALNALIPEDQWNLCMSRFSNSEEFVEIDSSNLNIHPSILAGRIRKEANNYTILNNLVGQNLVRHLFGEDI